MNARAMYQHLIRMTYFTTVASMLTGALNLWLTIHFWLTGMPLLSAMFTCLAFWNGKLYLDDVEQRRRLRALMREFEDRERMIERLR